MAWKPDYLTLAEVRGFLRLPPGDTVDDTELQVWITSASRAIDDRCQRQFGQVAAPVALIYRSVPAYDPSSGLWLLAIDDVQTTAGLLVNGVAYASSGAVLLPDNAPLEGRPWTHLGLTVPPVAQYPGAPVLNTVTAQWGWTAMPTQVGGAARLQINRWNSRRDSPMGIAGSPESGSELRLLARLDPDVATILAGLSRGRKPF